MRDLDALRAEDAPLLDLVEAVRALPYGRPQDRTVEGMLRERRGTCSTKHLFLARMLEQRHCDPAVREPFIAALARAGVGTGQPRCR